MTFRRGQVIVLKTKIFSFSIEDLKIVPSKSRLFDSNEEIA